MTRRQLAKKALEIIDTHECRMPPLLGVNNLTRACYDTIVQWCTNENFRKEAAYLPQEVEAVLIKAGVAEKREVCTAFGWEKRLEAVE